MFILKNKWRSWVQSALHAIQLYVQSGSDVINSNFRCLAVQLPHENMCFLFSAWSCALFDPLCYFECSIFCSTDDWTSVSIKEIVFKSHLWKKKTTWLFRHSQNKLILLSRKNLFVGKNVILYCLCWPIPSGRTTMSQVQANAKLCTRPKRPQGTTCLYASRTP